MLIFLKPCLWNKRSQKLLSLGFWSKNIRCEFEILGRKKQTHQTKTQTGIPYKAAVKIIENIIEKMVKMCPISLDKSSLVCQPSTRVLRRMPTWGSRSRLHVCCGESAWLLTQPFDFCHLWNANPLLLLCLNLPYSWCRCQVQISSMSLLCELGKYPLIGVLSTFRNLWLGYSV